MRYIYHGDKLTAPELKGMLCDPVRKPNDKCILSYKMQTALVVDATGRRHVVLRRLLRLNKLTQNSETKVAETTGTR